MKSDATFFIVPGFKQKSSDKSFVWLVLYLKKMGFKVVVVSIKWDFRVMLDYINDFKKYYKKHKSTVNYVLGFSYGAVITFSSANDLVPDKIFLCSLSPAFAEDISAMKEWVRKLIGKKRLKDEESRSARKIAQELKIPSVIFYGERESKLYPQFKIRCEETAKLAKDSKLILIPKAPHKIDYPLYIEAIKSELNLLENEES